MANRNRKWRTVVLIAVIALAAIATSLFAIRSYRTYVLLRSAYEIGVPQTGIVRAWMTLGYLASTYRIPPEQLLVRLDLPPATSLDASLRTIGERQGLAPFAYVQQVQRSIAGIAAVPSSSAEPATHGWSGWFHDLILSALLSYGYAVLGLTLLIGAIGLPVPTGLAAVLAGSLAASGRWDWLVAGTVAVTASSLGDGLVYGLGRGVSESFLERRGRWFGYSARRLEHARAMFARWGVLAVLITRTLISHLSTVVSLTAGISHYRLAAFLAVALAGRALWTAAYMALGYGIGGSFDYATDFLKNFSLLLVSATVLAGSLVTLAGRRGTRG